ncbi:MAG: glycosyltransferase family 39 protein, partial [candidate division Zixibacteria bacterium]|nr:glycosyltransferase family 39 protein [candidate division Zixibacteria bacterium]
GRWLLARGDYESAVFSHGPGYPCFLMVSFVVFGVAALPALVIQLILASLSCALLYLLAIELLGDRAVGLTAGLLSAVSVTGVFLSCSLLSDSLHYFVFLTGLLLFVRGLRRGSWACFVLCGLLTAGAILIHPVGLFWPVVTALIAFLWIRRRWYVRHNRLILKVMVCIAIMLVTAAGWVIRNWCVHGCATIAFSSAGGPATVAAMTLGRMQNRPHREILREWLDDYLRKNGRNHLSAGENYWRQYGKFKEVLAEHPWRLVETYFRQDWTNINDISYQHRLLIPRYDYITRPLEGFVKRYKLNYLTFLLSVIGLVMLCRRSESRAALVLGCVLVYYSLLIGFFPWQGSRYFYPGHISADILLSVVIVCSARLLLSAFGRWRPRAGGAPS